MLRILLGFESESEVVGCIATMSRLLGLAHVRFCKMDMDYIRACKWGQRSHETEPAHTPVKKLFLTFVILSTRDYHMICVVISVGALVLHPLCKNSIVFSV